jgi:hypothetical protein
MRTVRRISFPPCTGVHFEFCKNSTRWPQIPEEDQEGSRPHCFTVCRQSRAGYFCDRHKLPSFVSFCPGSRRSHPRQTMASYIGKNRTATVFSNLISCGPSVCSFSTIKSIHLLHISGGDNLHMGRVSVNALNKQSWTDNRTW